MGTTSTYGLRWPEPTGRVFDGAAAMRALAEDVDDRNTPVGGVQIAPANSGVALTTAAAVVTFPGTQEVMAAGFAYAAGVITYTGPTRPFIVSAEVVVRAVAPAGGGAGFVSDLTLVDNGGAVVAASTDQLTLEDTLYTDRWHTHRLVAPVLLGAGNTLKVMGTMSPDGAARTTALRVYPIGPALT